MSDATIWSITVESSITILHSLIYDVYASLMIPIGLYHPLNGVTNPNYKL